MPKAFRAVGIVTPNRWFIDGAALIRDGRFPLASLIVLLASGLVLLALAVPALRRRDLGVTHERHPSASSTWPGTTCRLMVGDKVFFFWTLAFPILFIVLFGLLYKAGDNAPPSPS